MYTELQTGLKYAAARLFNKSITVKRDDPSAFAHDFEDLAVSAVQQIASALLTTKSYRKETRVRDCILGNAEDEGLATEDCPWEPRYAIRFANSDGQYETRLIGHVEFLAGRTGALTEAFNMKGWRKWGSPRCVLGKQPPPFPQTKKYPVLIR